MTLQSGIPRFVRRACLAVLLACACAPDAHAQNTPAAIATKLADSLVFVNTPVSGASLVWCPVRKRYYSARQGNSTFALETWLSSGGLSIAQTTCGIDTRGMWYNPNTGDIERNCFAALGWATMDTDASSNAVNTFTTLFTGMLQPNAQSNGAYDPSTNTVLFYASGAMEVRSRDTGAIVQTLPLTGTSLVNVNTTSVIYTGQAGYEVGLLDYAAKVVLLFDRNTGAFTGQSQLPANAQTYSQSRFCYTNGDVWLFNSTLRKWNAYCIWQQACPTYLPVELLSFSAECERERPPAHLDNRQ